MIRLTLDTETDLIRPGNQFPDLACVALRVGGQGSLFHGAEQSTIELVREILANPEILIVGHSIAYDMGVFLARDFSLWPLIRDAYKANRITDTEIRGKLLDIAAGTRKFYDDGDGAEKSTYALDALAERFLNRKLDKNTWRLRYGELRRFPLDGWPEGARLYPLEDVRATDDLYEIQATQDPRFLRDEFRQARAAFWIRLMGGWGIHTDEQGIRELARRTEQEYQTVARDMRMCGLLRDDRTVRRRTGAVETLPGARNTKAAQAMIIEAYRRQGRDFPRTATGLPALDEQACQDSGNKTLIAYAKLARLKAILSKDIPLLERGIKFPIHSRFETLQESGRTGSADPNIQNPKRSGGIRECFVPRCLTCGHVLTANDVGAQRCQCGAGLTVFLECDYSGAELCTLAQTCLEIVKFSYLADALNAGRDPHLMIAEQILGQPYDLLKETHGAGPQAGCVAEKAEHCPCPYCTVDNARQTGKVANFGFMGGLGPVALVAFALAQYGVRLTEDQARDLKRTWMRMWPEMRKFFDYIDRCINQPFPCVEQLYSGRWVGNPIYTKACNTYAQGLAADMAKEAGWLILEATFDPSSPLFGCRIVNFVHDAFMLECPEFRAKEAAKELSRLMIEAAKVWIPDVKIKAKPVIMRRWSKKPEFAWAA